MRWASAQRGAGGDPPRAVADRAEEVAQALYAGPGDEGLHQVVVGLLGVVEVLRLDLDGRVVGVTSGSV